jgi:hypothetical protein
MDGGAPHAIVRILMIDSFASFGHWHVHGDSGRFWWGPIKIQQNDIKILINQIPLVKPASTPTRSTGRNPTTGYMPSPNTFQFPRGCPDFGPKNVPIWENRCEEYASPSRWFCARWHNTGLCPLLVASSNSSFITIKITYHIFAQAKETRIQRASTQINYTRAIERTKRESLFFLNSRSKKIEEKVRRFSWLTHSCFRIQTNNIIIILLILTPEQNWHLESLTS